MKMFCAIFCPSLINKWGRKTQGMNILNTLISWDQKHLCLLVFAATAAAREVGASDRLLKTIVSLSASTDLTLIYVLIFPTCLEMRFTCAPESPILGQQALEKCIALKRCADLVESWTLGEGKSGKKRGEELMIHIERKESSNCTETFLLKNSTDIQTVNGVQISKLYY